MECLAIHPYKNVYLVAENSSSHVEILTDCPLERFVSTWYNTNYVEKLGKRFFEIILFELGRETNSNE